MAVAECTEQKNKRKQTSETDTPIIFPAIGELELLSDDDDAEDGDTRVLPEIDLDSDDNTEELEEKNSIDSEEDEGEAEDEQVDEDEEDDFDSNSDASEAHFFPKAKTVISSITGHPKVVYPVIEPDYNSDSSTEDAPNRVGKIPMHWYDDLPHIGYDIDGKRILRPARGDELDKFLATVDDPLSRTSAFDENMQVSKPLTNEELDIIRRLYAGENPDAGYDPYEPMIEWFTGKGKEEIMPLSSAPEPKSRWAPSKWEKQKVMKIVRAIRQGRIVGSRPKTTSKVEFYSLWSEPLNAHPPPDPAPRLSLPSNSESYNPPEEYLPTDEERKHWEVQDEEDRERNYLSQKYSSLRLVPGYDRFIKERFDRQLDLYLAPRIQRIRPNVDADSLVPKLPSPNSLKPFPTYKSHAYRCSSRAKAVSISPDGIWVVCGDEHGKVSIWELNIGREVKSWNFGSKIGALEWCPRQDVSFFVVSTEETLHFVVPPNLSPSMLSATQLFLTPPISSSPSSKVPTFVKWILSPTTAWSDDDPLVINLPSTSGLPTQISWHRRGDYFASVSTSGTQAGVWIHQVSRRHSQAPFKKVKGLIQLSQFHPLKPHLFVATKQYVRVYDLSEQKLLRTLMPGIKWISSMDIHPTGNHVIVGGYDRKLCWFDLELSNKPFRVLRYHTRAIRSVQFHPSYPLFASSSDDGAIQIFHARIYSDLTTDPLIVPLKILRGHEVQEGLGVLQVKWCHRYPWLVSGGADGTIALWCS